MNLNEIKAAVDAGQRVGWASCNYQVIKDSRGQYLIAYRHGTRDANYVSLTWDDGKTLNGREEDFYLDNY